MKKTAIEIYALLVCFFSMTCMLVTIGVAIYDVVRLVNPSLTISDDQYIDHQSNDSYWKYQSGDSNTIQVNGVTFSPKNDKPIKRPAETKLTEQRLASYQMVLDAEKRNAMSDLISEFIIVLVSSLGFFIHWRFVLHKKT